MPPPAVVKLLLLLVPSLGVAALAWRRPGRRRELALAVAATAVALLFAEAGLRTWAPQINQHDDLFEADPELGWTMRPHARATIVHPGGVRQTVRTNASGFRDHEWDRGAAPGLLVLGDSFTSNLSVPDASVFTEVLEAKRGGPEVYNLGVNGYGTVQQGLLLDRHLARLRPEAVLVVVFLQNDPADNLDAPWLFGRPFLRPQGEGFVLEPPGAHPAPRTGPLHPRRQSHVWAAIDRLVEQGLARLRRDRPSPWRPPELALCREPLDPAGQTAMAAMGAALARLQSRTAAAGVPLGVALAPSDVLVDPVLWDALQSTWGVAPGELDRDALARRVAAEATALGLPTLDLTGALRAAHTRGERPYHPAERHWTAAGNAVVAEALDPWLTDHLWR